MRGPQQEKENTINDKQRKRNEEEKERELGKKKEEYEQGPIEQRL